MKTLLRRLLPSFCFLAALAGLPGQVAAPAAPTPAAVDASAATPKTGNKRFFELHESFLKRAKEGPIGVLFLGDSITEGWNKAPHIWEHFFGKYQPANFGISGDQTQHVIWRLENGELDGISPKVVVLMLGTNNTGRNTGAEIAAADRKIVEMIRTRLPDTKVLLLAIFPRGPRKDWQGKVEDAVARMEVIRAANAELARLDDGKYVRFLDLNARFLADDGSIPHIIMPDQLHPDAAGYELWAEAMLPLLDQMMQ
ncbi:MAG TPA: GDSL-type esterase/lipase family protein [Lacunisphaera sp.]|jgi:beta-glucosidase|nr:GDSL-type esterase/lipase family protein [Lacunisphaera sp.]